MRARAVLLFARLLVTFEKTLVRALTTMLAIYVLFLLHLPSVDRYTVIVEGHGIQETIANVLTLIISLVLHVLTLYTVFAQEENELVGQRDAVLRLLEECSLGEVRKEVYVVLRVINETLRDASRTWVRWAVYELPYAYAPVLPLVFVLYLYSAPVPDTALALLLPRHLSWGKILAIFTAVFLVSGLALAYVFRRGYERKSLQLQVLSTRCHT